MGIHEANIELHENPRVTGKREDEPEPRLPFLRVHLDVELKKKTESLDTLRELIEDEEWEAACLTAIGMCKGASRNPYSKALLRNTDRSKTKKSK